MDQPLPSDDTPLIDLFPYPSLLASNDIPSDSEIEEIKAFLAEPTERIQETEAEISSLEARIELLRARQASLKQQVEACRSSITMPRRLPDDILLEIFFRCLPETSIPKMDGTIAPSLLTAVCRRWRTLALQTPTLWSAIYIPIDDVEKKRSMSRNQINALRKAYQQHLCTMLSMWLARSATCPLTLILCLFSSETRFGTISNYIETTYTKCLQILLSSTSRWKNVSFWGNTKLLSTLLEMPTSEFQSLESLFLKLTWDPLPDIVPMLHAPRLRKISIQTNVIDPTIHLPWAQLTHLDLGGVTSHEIPINQFSTILSQCTSLIYLGLDITRGQNLRAMYLPNLQRIFIRQKPALQTHSEANSLFPGDLDVPSLRQMSLRDLDDASFSAVLKRYGQSITGLDFNTGYIEFKTFSRSISHCPSLESLSIIRLPGQGNHFKVKKNFFTLFTPNDAKYPSPLCPALRDLTLDNIGCETLDGLLSFLQSRQNMVPFVPSSGPIKISTAFVREGDKGIQLSEEMVKQVLKPFVDSNILSEFRMMGHRQADNDRLCSHLGRARRILDTDYMW